MTIDIDCVDVSSTVDDLALGIVLAKLVQVFRLQLDTADGRFPAVPGPRGLPADVGSVALVHPAGVVLSRGCVIVGAFSKQSLC